MDAVKGVALEWVTGMLNVNPDFIAKSTLNPRELSHRFRLYMETSNPVRGRVKKGAFGAAFGQTLGPDQLDVGSSTPTKPKSAS